MGGEEMRFATDLYRGTAASYDRYRLPYPEVMLGDLISRAGFGEHGRLLDLACGTGQLAFPLRRWFGEVWAVDQESDMVDAVRAKAAAAGAREVRAIVASAESLDAEPESFDAVVIGNAFHRLDRDVVVVPAGWDEARRSRSDTEVLGDAGFEMVGRSEFAGEHRWSLPELAGHIRSTSFLPESVLGRRSAAFDADLAASLAPHGDGGGYAETVTFAYDLARKPVVLTRMG